MTATQMQQMCAGVIRKRIYRLTNKETYTSVDPASGRSEETKKGEWMGSAYEKELFDDLLKEILSFRP